MLNAAAISRLVNQPNTTDVGSLLVSPSLDLEKNETSGNASIDLRLGCWFLTSRLSKAHLLDVAGKSLVKTEKPSVAKHYVPFGQQFILHPRSFVLAATIEWIKLPNNLAGLVSGKSSWGRRGLVIETAPGVHPGFGGCLTLELANVGEIPIALYPGLTIAQLFLFNINSHLYKSSQSSFSGKRQPIQSSIKPDLIAKALIGF